MVSYYMEAVSQVEPGNEFSFSPSLQHSVTCCSYPPKIFCRWFWPFTEHTDSRLMTYIFRSLHLVQPLLLIGQVSEIRNLRNFICLQEEYLWWRHTVSFSTRKVSFVVINSFKWFELLWGGFMYNIESFLLMQNWVRYFRIWKNGSNLHIYTNCNVNWCLHKEKKMVSTVLSSFMGPICFLWKSHFQIHLWCQSNFLSQRMLLNIKKFRACKKFFLYWVIIFCYAV